MVAASSDHVTGGATGQFVEVGLGDLIETEAQLTGELSDVPKDITELELQGLPDLRGKLATAIAQHFFDLVRDLSGFAAEAQGWVDGVGAHIGIAGRLPRTLLISIQIHWYDSAGGPR